MTQSQAGSDAPVPFREAFDEFVFERVSRDGFRWMSQRVPMYRRQYEEVTDRLEALRKQIAERVGWDLADRYENLMLQYVSTEAEAAYVIGLKDGMMLAFELWVLDGKYEIRKVGETEA